MKHLYVEGHTDVWFLAAYLHFLNGQQIPGLTKDLLIKGTSDNKAKTTKWVFTYKGFSCSLVQMGGFARIREFPQVFDNRANDPLDRCYLVFDSDHPATNGGFLKRQTELKTIWQTDVCRQALNVHAVTIFLFPNNHDDGELETLVERIAREEHRQIMTGPWAGFVKDLQVLTDPDVGRGNHHYFEPTQKSKVHEYAGAISDTVWMDKGFCKSFFPADNTNKYWDFTSPALEPLKDFLLTKVFV